MNTKTLMQFTLDNQMMKIVATKHAIKRMNQRKIDQMLVISAITSIGEDNLKKIRRDQSDAMVIDQESNLGVVFAIKGGRITIITTIQKENIFVKNNTELFKI